MRGIGVADAGIYIGDAARLQAADDVIEPTGLLHRQAGGWLVEDEQLRLVRKRPGNRHHLPVGGAEFREIPIERQVETGFVENAARLLPDR